VELAEVVVSAARVPVELEVPGRARVSARVSAARAPAQVSAELESVGSAATEVPESTTGRLGYRNPSELSEFRGSFLQPTYRGGKVDGAT
jgi:hypothetical protein